MDLKKEVLEIEGEIKKRIRNELGIRKRKKNVKKKAKDNEKMLDRISEKQTTLLFVPGVEYSETIIDMIRHLNQKKLCYVTINKTQESLKDLFKRHKISTDNIFFIDAISESIKKIPSQTADCYFIKSPKEFKEMLKAVSKFLSLGVDYIIFDSLSNLLVYEKNYSIKKLIFPMIKQIRKYETKAIFLVSVKEQEGLIRDCAELMDHSFVTWERAQSQLII